VVHALGSLRKSVEINPNWGLSQFALAGALALAGLPVEAAEVCATAGVSHPVSPSPNTAPKR
jgi:hypothetical protein